MWIKNIDFVSLWKSIYHVLKDLLPGHALNTWFEPLVPVAITENELILEAPNQFSFEWIDSHYKNNLKEAVGVVTKNSMSYRFIVSAKGQKKQKQDAGVFVQPQKHSLTAPNNLNRSYTFSNFIQGSNSEFAKSACESVSDDPGKNSFNPLIIYGGVGLGKTHLLHSIGNKVHSKNPNTKVVIVTSEKFTLDFVNSLRKNKTIEFAQQYRNADVLLIDDIQFLEEKNKHKNSSFTLSMFYNNLGNKLL